MPGVGVGVIVKVGEGVNVGVFVGVIVGMGVDVTVGCAVRVWAIAVGLVLSDDLQPDIRKEEMIITKFIYLCIGLYHLPNHSRNKLPKGVNL